MLKIRNRAGIALSTLLWCFGSACGAADDYADDGLGAEEMSAAADVDEPAEEAGAELELGTARQAISAVKTDSIYTDLGANHHMWTTARVDPSSGLLQANTRTATFTLLGGFRGGVQVLFVDADGFIIYTSHTERYGVDGKWIGRNDRTEYWEEWVPMEIVAAADHMEVVQFWSEDWFGNLDRWLTVGRRLVDAWQEVKDVLGTGAGKSS